MNIDLKLELEEKRYNDELLNSVKLNLSEETNINIYMKKDSEGRMCFFGDNTIVNVFKNFITKINPAMVFMIDMFLPMFKPLEVEFNIDEFNPKEIYLNNKKMSASDFDIDKFKNMNKQDMDFSNMLNMSNLMNNNFINEVKSNNEVSAENEENDKNEESEEDEESEEESEEDEESEEYVESEKEEDVESEKEEDINNLEGKTEELKLDNELLNSINPNDLLKDLLGNMDGLKNNKIEIDNNKIDDIMKSDIFQNLGASLGASLGGNLGGNKLPTEGLNKDLLGSVNAIWKNDFYDELEDDNLEDFLIDDDVVVKDNIKVEKLLEEKDCSRYLKQNRNNILFELCINKPEDVEELRNKINKNLTRKKYDKMLERLENEDEEEDPSGITRKICIDEETNDKYILLKYNLLNNEYKKKIRYENVENIKEITLKLIDYYENNSF